MNSLLSSGVDYDQITWTSDDSFLSFLDDEPSSYVWYEEILRLRNFSPKQCWRYVSAGGRSSAPGIAVVNSRVSEKDRRRSSRSRLKAVVRVSLF